MTKGVNEVDSWVVASYVDCRLPLGTLSPQNAACPEIPVRTRRKRTFNGLSPAIADRLAPRTPSWLKASVAARRNSLLTGKFMRFRRFCKRYRYEKPLCRSHFLANSMRKLTGKLFSVTGKFPAGTGKFATRQKRIRP